MRSRRHISLRILWKFVSAFGLMLLPSCAHYQCDSAYGGPKARGPEVLEYYSYPRQTIEAKVETIEHKKKYVVERIEFPSARNVFGTENIRLDYYVQKKPGKFPAVLILPIAGGIELPVKNFAHHFASNGFNCAVVHNRQFNLRDIKSVQEIEDYFRQTVLDNRQVLDYLVKRPEVDVTRLGCLGLSLGGIKASLVAAVDERLKCCVLALAGGSIAEVAVLSEEKPIRDYFRELAKKGTSRETIRVELSEKVKTDPLKLAEYIDARNVLMYIARFDRIVPTKCGDRLRQAIGKPEAIHLFSGHYSSFLYSPYAEAESLRFFKKKFELK